MANTFLENLDTLKKRLTVVPLSKMPLEENPHLDLLCNFEARPIILSDGSAVISELQKYITGIWEEQEFYIPYKGDYLLVKYPEYNWPIKRDNDSDRNRIFLVLDKENNEVAFVFG